MDEKLIERAIAAAETALLGRTFAVTQARQREDLRDAVTAALAEVEADIRANAIRMTPSAGLLYELAGRIEKEGKS